MRAQGPDTKLTISRRVHAQVKSYCRARGETMQRWVTGVLVREMREAEKARPRVKAPDERTTKSELAEKAIAGRPFWERL